MQQGIQYFRAMLTNVSDVMVIIVKFIYCKIVQIAFQTELTCQRIQEFESQASSDLELRNNKIDELNRVSMVVIMIINLFKFYYSYVRIKLCETYNLPFSLSLSSSLFNITSDIHRPSFISS